jgi:hypothetical protein
VLPRQALKEETEPGGQRGLVEMAGHGQRRIAELLPSVLLAKRLLGEVTACKTEPWVVAGLPPGEGLVWSFKMSIAVALTLLE